MLQNQRNSKNVQVHLTLSLHESLFAEELRIVEVNKQVGIITREKVLTRDTWERTRNNQLEIAYSYTE